jgi:hypothetical protein
MPSRPRKPDSATQQIVPLLLLGIGLVTTNNSVTFLNDEAIALGSAVKPLQTLISRSIRGTGVSGYHPLFDAILHFWLRATGGNFDYLRIPSVLFFLAGLFLLRRASRRFTPVTGGIAVIWLGVLWPFSFHFSRLAVWSSFSFFLVAGLTLSYLEYLENRTKERWAVLFFFCVALIWTTYWGWAILACLVADQLLRATAKEPAATAKSVVVTSLLLFACFIPFFPALRSAISKLTNLHQGAVSGLANAGFNVFSLFASNSVAPWYWRLSVPVAIAILACIVLTARHVPHPALRFLVYSGCVLAMMAVSETLRPTDLLMLSPWVLLPVGVAIETQKPRWATFALAAALLAIGAAGWYGIYSKRFYSAPQLIEPWQEIARDAAVRVANGTTVISEQPAFLFYLTYDLQATRQNPSWKFEGLLPDQVTHPNVFSPLSWLAEPHAAIGKVLLVRKGTESGEAGPIDEAAQKLDASCGSISSRLRIRDDGYAWKRRYLPQLREPLWRIEVRDYDCGSSSSGEASPTAPK